MSRITKKVSDTCIELYPQGALPIRINKNDNDTELSVSEHLWGLIEKLCAYEEAEEQYDMTLARMVQLITDPTQASGLSDDVIEAAYRIQEHRYYTEDAKRHADAYVEDNDIKLTKPLDDDDYDWLAMTFESDHDCNAADNDQWDFIVSDYVGKLQKEEDD